MNKRLLSAAASVVVTSLNISQSMAASQTWSGTPTDANWTTAANWVGNAVPGINPTANAHNTTDVATFNAAITGTIGTSANPIINDGTAGNNSGNRMIGRIVFDTVNAGSYFIGATGSTTTLQLGNNLTDIAVNAAVVNAQTINAPIALHLPSSTNGAGLITSDSTTSTATLTLAGGILNSPNSTRGTVWTLTGANTGLNTVSGVINITNSGGTSSQIIKAGAGTWALTAANTIGGGTTINAGTLIAGNNQALGVAANGVTVNAGTLEISNGISLLNTTLNLAEGSTLRGNGTATVNTVAIAAATVNSNISTVGSGDVFTLGAVNGTTATGATLNVNGPGQTILNAAGNFGGTWSINGGTTTLNNATALGTATVASLSFGAGSTGKVQLNNNNVTLVKLNTNASVGTPVIENGGASDVTLTLNTTANSTYKGTIQDGSGSGKVALVKGGAGTSTLTLGGASTYSNGTSINAGTLVISNTSGSATGSGAVNLASTTTLSGTGIATGIVTANSNATLSPGAGTGNVGTFHVGGLVLSAGSKLAYDVTNTSTLDQVIVDNSNGLQIDGGTFSLNGGSSFTTNGVYNLIGYSGSINGTGIGALALDPANQNLATNTYTFGTSGGFVTLTVASSGGVVTYWNTDNNGNWSVGPWTTPTPNAAGKFVSFGGGGTAITANRTITVDGAYTAGTIAFNNPSFSYTLNPGTGAGITLDNSTSTSFITDTAGSHAINVPVTLTANGATVTVTNATDTLTVSGAIGGNGAIVKAGAGSLVLSGTNTYTGGTTANAGTLVINSDASLGDAAGGVTFGGGTLKATANITSARNIQTKDLADANIDTNGNTVVLTGTISPQSGATGGLVKSGAGTLDLQGNNSYVGATSVNAGTLIINSNTAIGDATAAAGLNLASGTTLATTASATLTGRPVSIGASGSTISVPTGVDLTLTGVVTGGTVTKVDAGRLRVSNTSNTTPFVVSAGTLNAAGTTGNTNGGFGTGAITLQGGASLTHSMSASNTLSFANALTVPTGQTGNISLGERWNWTGTVSGGGTLNVTAATGSSRDDFNNNWTAFTGTLNLAGSGNVRMIVNGGTFNSTSLANAIVNVDGTVNLAPATNTNGNTFTFGTLGGTSTTASLGGGTAGTPRYTFGGLNADSSFAGIVSGNASLVKNGTGTQTFTGFHTYTGSLTVNTGTVVLSSPTQTPVALTGDTAAGLNLMIVTSTTGLTIGQRVTGAGIPAGTVITAIDTGTNTLTFNNNLTTTSTAAAFTAEGSGIAGLGTAAVTNNGTIVVPNGGNLQGVTGTGTLNVPANTTTISAAVTQAALVNNGTVDAQAGGTITAVSGTGTLKSTTATLNVPGGLKQGNITATGTGVIAIPLNGSATAVAEVGSVTTDATGRVELHDNDLVINYGTNPSAYTDTINKVKSGLVLLGGTGNGIGSTEVDAQTVQGTILAVVDDGDANIGGAITATSGYTLTAPTTSVIVKFTWFGDSNLDGIVDGSDYALLDSGFTSGASLGGWVFGDYDYSGTVDGSDYALIDTGFISQNAVLPEPTTLGLLGLGAMGMLGRRRKA